MKKIWNTAKKGWDYVDEKVSNTTTGAIASSSIMASGWVEEGLKGTAKI